jgi:formylglycine-generating enzyme required for sulfatase activity
LVIASASCGYPALPDLVGDDAASSDGPVLTAFPSAFDLHANDTRDVLLMVTNSSSQSSGTPVLQVTGLTLGTLTIASSTCTTGLAPGASCTAIGHLTATTAGQTSFQVIAPTSPGGTAMTALSVTVRLACPATCGANAATNCCASSVVPGNATGATLAGASFYRSYDVATDGTYPNMSYPATVSDFRLDTYEVTVGRFRAFVNAGMGTTNTAPAAGAGAHAAIPGSGWDSSWNSNLSADTTTLKANVKCDAFQTWTDTAGANESLPMNCITWYEAMAFCLWDGGYLPTEAEWNYTAAGGSEQRAYPWSSPASSTTIDCSYANYFIDNPAGTFCVNGTNRVGNESTKGDGKWGQSDLGGNVWEWMLDWSASPYPTTTCKDCANLAPATARVIRGGAFNSFVNVVRAGFRNSDSPTSRFFNDGVRCARTP